MSPISNTVSKLCAKDKCKLDYFGPITKTRWVQRKVKVCFLGLFLSSQRNAASSLWNSLLNPPKYFLQSYESKIAFLQNIFDLELFQNLRTELYGTLADKCACTIFLPWQKEFRSKIRQPLSDDVSSQKRMTSNELFSLPGYYCLLSKYVAHSELENTFTAVKLVRT